MSQTVIGLPDDLPEQATVRLLLLDHAVELNRIVVDVRTSLFGSWTPIRRERLSHRIEGDESDEGLDAICRCCARSCSDVCAANDAGSGTPAGDPLPVSRMQELQERYDEMLIALAGQVDLARAQRDAAEERIDRLNTELENARAEISYLHSAIGGWNV